VSFIGAMKKKGIPPESEISTLKLLFVAALFPDLVF